MKQITPRYTLHSTGNPGKWQDVTTKMWRWTQNMWLIIEIHHLTWTVFLLISFLCQQISCILTLVQFKDPNATLKISSFLFLWIHSVSQDFLLFVQHRKHTLAWRPDRLHSICNILGCLHHITAIHRSSSLLLVHGNFHVPDQIFLLFFYDWSLQLLLLPNIIFFIISKP